MLQCITRYVMSFLSRSRKQAATRRVLAAGTRRGSACSVGFKCGRRAELQLSWGGRAQGGRGQWFDGGGQATFFYLVTVNLSFSVLGGVYCCCCKVVVVE